MKMRMRVVLTIGITGVCVWAIVSLMLGTVCGNRRMNARETRVKILNICQSHIVARGRPMIIGKAEINVAEVTYE